MAKIEIITTPEEQELVLEALKKFEGTTVPVTTIAKQANLKQNRVRYVLVDLEDAGKIRRVPTKAFNSHYIRYKYDIVKQLPSV